MPEAKDEKPKGETMPEAKDEKPKGETMPEAKDEKPKGETMPEAGGYIVRLQHNPTVHIEGATSEGDAVAAYKSWFGITATEHRIAAAKSDGTADVKAEHCLSVKDGKVGRVG